MDKVRDQVDLNGDSEEIVSYISSSNYESLIFIKPFKQSNNNKAHGFMQSLQQSWELGR